MTQPPQQPYPPAGLPPGPYSQPPYAYRPLPPVPLSPGGAPLADFGTRLLAYLIDTAVMTGVLMVFAVPAFIVVFVSMSDNITSIDPYGAQPDPADVFGGFFLPFLLVELGLFVVMLVLYYIYYVEIIRRTGQSIGKKAMKIRIVPLDPAETLTRGHLVKRYLIEFIGGVLIPLFSYLDGLWQLWDKPYQQALHDKVAKTVVVRVPV